MMPRGNCVAATWMVVLGLPIPVLAGPYDLADSERGKQLVQRHCTSCHVSGQGGDGSGIYTRPDHKINSLPALRAQISRCNAGTGARLSVEDERDIGAYLHRTYYKFN